MIRVRFLPAAELELLKEIAYYSNARPGTGHRFQAAVQAAVSRAATRPQGGAPSYKETRSVLGKGFPLVLSIAPPKTKCWLSPSLRTASVPTTGSHVSNDGQDGQPLVARM